MRAIIMVVFGLVTSLATLACAHAGPLGHNADQSPVDVVNLNTASENELIDLPGIGPTKAAAILAYRKKHGTFARVDELAKVKGFGRKTVARLRSSLSVAPPPTAAAPP